MEKHRIDRAGYLAGGPKKKGLPRKEVDSVIAKIVKERVCAEEDGKRVLGGLVL